MNAITRSLWFRYYGKLWKVARIGAYGFDYRIIAVSKDGELWDKLGHLNDTDEIISDNKARQLDVENPSVVHRCIELVGKE